ncbi:MAG: S49 family peptidase [Proteobacteria bacterium]|nr:S49 family peptidase [Pseudomonadota bacterium]MBU1640086.1 S49 family peptidase [Pseudomonadota bacterium]
MKDKPTRVMAAVYGQPWLISHAGMTQVLAIVNRITDVSALVAGRPTRPEGSKRLKVYGSTAVVPIHGAIIRYADVFEEMCGSCSLESVSHDFHLALADPAIKRIVFDVNSPGGQADGIHEFAEIVHQARGQKEIIGYASGSAASAALWILSACSKAYCDATSMLGSIGVLMSFRGGDGEDNIIHVTSSQSPQKRLDPGTDEGHALVLATADSMAAVFVKSVARNRNVSEQTVVNDFGQGWVLVGEEAVKAGLADGLSSLAELVGQTKPGQTPTTGGVAMSSPNPTNPDQGGSGARPQLTAAAVTADYPEIAAELRQAGAYQERTRIRAVLDLAPGAKMSGSLVALAFDGTTTEAEAALALLKTDDTKRAAMAQNLATDSLEIPAIEPAAANQNTDHEAEDAAVSAILAGAKH